MICFHPCKGTNLIFSAPKTDRHWVWFVFGGINEKCSQQSTNHAVGGEPYNQGRLAVRPAPPLCTLLTQSRGGAVGNRWARASVWSERMRDEDVSLLWWQLQASGSIWRPADWEVLYLRSMRFHSNEQSALSKGLFLNQYSFYQGSPVLCCPHCIGSPTGQMPRAGQANACSAGVSLVSGSLDLREFSSDTQACLLYMRSSQYIQEQSTFFFSCMY